MPRVPTTNHLLSHLSDEDFTLLAKHLEPIECPRGYLIVKAEQLVSHVYFLESGVGSIIVSTPEGHKAEAGLFGREGFAPVEALFADRAPFQIVMQLPGRGSRLERSDFVRAARASTTLMHLLGCFSRALNVQTSYTAVSNSVHHIDERLARWLLMCHDRSESDDMPLTHEFLSIMLAVRRPSVTSALHVLEGNGFIRAERGYVTIRNRTALEDFAADAYGPPEAEYERLIGPFK